MNNHQPGMMPTCFLAVFFLKLAIAVVPLRAGGGPENLFLVVNADVPASLAVANHYIQLRNIPAINVLYLDRIPEGRTCPLDVFRQRIGDRVIRAIEDRGIADHIDFVTFSSDFPTAIQCGSHLELLKQQHAPRDERVFQPVVSTNTLMTFYLYASRDDVSYMSLDANWYMSRPSGDVLRQPFLGETAQRWNEGVVALESGDADTAIGIFSGLVEQHPGQVAGKYQLARALAQAGRLDESLVALSQARAAGWHFREFAQNDRWLDPLEDKSEFQKLLRQMPDAPYGEIPSRGFSSQVVWGPNGWPNSTPDQGKRLLLTTMLGIGGGVRGCTRDQMIAQLERSVAADGTRPTGSFFFSKTPDVRSRTRQPEFRKVITDLQKLGFRAHEIRTRVPENRADVLGATLGSANIDWNQSGSRFLPGSICDNLTSHGGGMEEFMSQTPLTHFLKMGAAGASGTVVEPFAIAQKFPSPRIHLHYARGCNLAEAFYQSVAGPFQLLIVGDPLCQPWARFPRFSVKGIESGETVTGNIRLNWSVDPDGPSVARFELYVDGRRIGVAPVSHSSVNLATTDLPDGWHELRVVAIDNTLIGTRSSQAFEFFTRRQGHEATLQVAGNGIYQQDRSLMLTASTTTGDRIQIMQNSRVVAELEGSSGATRIDCYLLGVGPTSLTARVATPDGEIASEPVHLMIRP